MSALAMKSLRCVQCLDFCIDDTEASPQRLLHSQTKSNVRNRFQRCGCKWLGVCDNCLPAYKKTFNPCIRCCELIAETDDDEDIACQLEDYKICAKACVELCRKDEEYANSQWEVGGSTLNLKFAGFDQVFSVLLYYNREDLFHIFSQFSCEDTSERLLDIIDVMATTTNMNLQQIFLKKFTQRLPKTKRPRQEDEVSLTCWLRGKKVKCYVNLLPQRNKVRLNCAVDARGCVSCGLFTVRM